jgi:glycosyltransferase involved in cell wall biosynthesis
MPHCLPAAEALRLAYFVRPAWRQQHPVALVTTEAARDLLRWLTDAPDLTQAARAWCAARLADGTAEAVVTPGLNIVGHFRYPSGLRRSVETLCGGVEAAGLPITRRDMRTDLADEPGREAFTGLEVHDITLLHVQPEPFFPQVYERADLTERRPRTHRVGYWYWETDRAPPIWADVADAVDEVWAATEFVANALRRTVSVPVFTFPPGVAMPAFEARQREHFGLPSAKEGRFAFLFAFHLSSVMERKNPFGLIAAFRMAFAPDEPVDLVLKVTSFGRHEAELQALREASAGLNVHLLDAVLSTEDTLALIAACDAYVSLHRSEGLGLTMAEAMLLGRPVIASRTSGNLDFMDEDNSLLVDGTLVPVGPGNPPYDPGSLWFEPSIKDAAGHLRRLYEDRAFAAELGARARHSAAARLSPAVAGRRIAARVRAIAEMRRQGILS